MNSNTSGITEIMRAVNQMNAAVRAWQESDPLRHLREQIRLIQEIDPFRELREQIKLVQEMDPLKEVRTLIKSIQQADPLKELREAIQYLNTADAFTNIKTTIQTYHQSEGFLALQQAFAQIQSKDLTLREWIAQSYPTSTLEEAYKDILLKCSNASIYDSEDAEYMLDTVITDVSTQLQDSPKSVLSLEFYLSTIIALLMLIYSQHMSDQSEERLTTKMNVMTQMLTTLVKQAELATEPSTFYVVERLVKLRAEPKPRSRVAVSKLYPNQKVRLVERRGKWVRIEYFNHISNIHENGWCLKKYLKLCKGRRISND